MRILLVDDQKKQLDFLEIRLLKSRLNEAEIVKTQSPVEAMKLLKRETFDLLFLDVEMPEMTGFELIEILGIDNLPPIIFTTAYAKYAVNAFRVNAVDFLLKPIDPEELDNALEKIQEKSLESRSKSITNLLDDPQISSTERLIVAQGQTYLLLAYDEIIRIQGSGSYSDFYLMDGRKITASKRLNFFWKRIEEKGFIRTHQSHIVNEKHILGYSKKDGGGFFLKNDMSVPISPQLKDDLKRRLGI
ncbi:MAG: LytR/AlgR family response regulator transcription factor [Crocinitomicaceae bacterium]